MYQKNILTDQIVLTIGYDIENLIDPGRRRLYSGEITTDHYGREVPKHAHGTINLDHKTSSTKIILDATMELYERIINKNLLVRRINVTANKVVTESEAKKQNSFEQIDLFTNYNELEKKRAKEEVERNLQKALINIKSRYGKNAILKGMNFVEGGTTIERNGQIGGHKG